MTVTLRYILAAALLAPWPSGAQGLAACRSIPDDTARLACFDRAAQEPAAAPQAVAGFGLAEPPPTKPEDFGRASLPAPAVPPRLPDEPAAIKAITAKVTRIIDPYGKPRFVLDNKQVWASANYVRITPRTTGDNTATIEDSPVGYLMRLNDSPAEFNVRRLQ
jgi:hypothetical protein